MMALNLLHAGHLSLQGSRGGDATTKVVGNGSNVRENHHLFEQYVFKPADRIERVQALALQHEIYSTDIGYAPHDSFDTESATYFVAVDQARKVVGSFRMVIPSYRPFDVEQYINLDEIFPPHRSIALVGRLCVRPENRSVSREGLLPIGLLKLAYEYAVSSRITDFVMYTFPRLQRFYERAFFSFTGASFLHPGYQTRMLVMRLDITAATSMSKSGDPWAQTLFGPRWRNIVLSP
jgi:N-acyl-L-homoserine lactone synthetase